MTEQTRPETPLGLAESGRRLWLSVTDQYDLKAAPEWLPVLESMCRTLDLIDRMQAIVDGADSLRVLGSQQQPVAMPELSEVRQHRALYAQLHRQLAQAFELEDGPDARSFSRMGNDARWNARG